MTARYDIRQDSDGWAIYDIRNGLPAAVNDVLQVGLAFENADDLADLLNLLRSEQALATLH